MQIQNDTNSFHSFDIRYIKNLVAQNELSLEWAELLLSYWKERLSNVQDSLYNNYFDYYLFFESMHSGIIHAFVLETTSKKTLHSYGILTKEMDALANDLPQVINQEKEFKKQETKKILDTTLNFYVHSLEYGKYVLAVLYPTSIAIEKQLEKITLVLKRFYLPETLSLDKRFFTLFSTNEKLLTEKCNFYLEQNKLVTFTYLQFESYKKDLQYIGEGYSHMIVPELRSFLREKLQLNNEDILLTLDNQHFLVISFDQGYEKIKEAFSGLTIQAKNIVFPYSIKVSTYNQPIPSLTSIWKQITQKQVI